MMQSVGCGLLPAQVARILVIRRKALGDVLVTLPAVLRLVEAFPCASLDLVVDRPYAPLLEGLTGRLRILAWPPESGGPAAWWRLLREGRYDIVVDYLGSPRTAFWSVLSGSRLRVGYDVRWRRWAYNLRVPRNREAGFRLNQFAGEAFLDPLRALGEATAPWQPGGLRPAGEPALSLRYRRWRQAWASRPRPRIGLVLSATWSAKAWPAGQACRLYDLLQADRCVPLFIMGPADGDLALELRQMHPQAEFAPPTSLPELANLLASLDLLLGTDCGARHLAVCLNVPTLTLFGPTDPRGWNPEDPRHVALRTGETCSPCDLKECRVEGHPCLDNLGSEQVLAAVRSLGPQLPGWRREREGVRA
jgi:ADP-heptose:LPS heptosyltransferase